MYHLSVANKGVLSSAQIAAMVAGREDTPAAMRHLVAIERIGARGIRYANEDFDVLSSAYMFATAERLPFLDYYIWQDNQGLWRISAKTEHEWNHQPSLPRSYDKLYTTEQAAKDALRTARMSYLENRHQ